VPLDFTKKDDIQIFFQLNMFVTRGLTLRFGFVPLTPNVASTQQARVVFYLLENYGVRALAVYLNGYISGSGDAPTVEALNAVTSEQALLPGGAELALKEILKSDELGQHVEMAQRWVKRLNAGTTTPPIFINGHPLPRTADWLNHMGQKLQEDVAIAQKTVASEGFDEEMSLVDHLLADARPSRNRHIYPEDVKAIKLLDLARLYEKHAELLGQALVLDEGSKALTDYPVAMTVVSDLTTREGFDLMRSALKFALENTGARVELLHNPAHPGEASQCPMEALKSYSGKLHELDADAFDDLMMASSTKATEGYTGRLSNYLQAVGLSAGDNALILNGRVVGPFAVDEVFTAADIEALSSYEHGRHLDAVLDAVKTYDLEDIVGGPLGFAKLATQIALAPETNVAGGISNAPPPRRHNAWSVWASDHTAINTGDEQTASVQVVALLNPASEVGQRWAPILRVLSQLEGVHVTIFLNPQERLTELPVKRFYRYVLESEPAFAADGSVKPPGAVFKGLPSEALLTAGMDVPPAWLVAAKESVHDLDNVKLASIKSGNVEAVYELESILIEGHSREAAGAPRGAQLVLGTQSEPHMTDTLIMANLGYFQFKTNPGVYTIKLKEGRSSEVFEIETIGARGWQPAASGVDAADEQDADIVHMTFQGTTLYPRLRRRPGQEQVDVLEPAEEHDDLLSQLIRLAKDLFGGGGKKTDVSAEVHADINIFSVASGHLYERMLNIMMVSVMKHTKHTVKFWFIEQFLSPSFKEFIVHLAAEYGFRYEMVTYKWPHWLRGQAEKQREIWGYKILFLDVLFPLSLDKVIFVDADQVVRTDMHDLVTHDLQGAPYGFAPMCDSRVEMEGFRFWKQGYWANYLRGLPYHISALYVVDLGRFRALAAGDRLRQQYHALSADPASLANLDQDLPNHMQFSIPIHSLPQDWLWCETWCSDESLATARTIDLCNNPQTKEPKLDRARRQVPEWTAYDGEIAALAGRVREQQQQGGKNPKSRRLDAEVESGGSSVAAEETEHVEL
jgi:UDP-glucose:glycoprotein glucosyltransferase